jgi:hypothetical protein
MDSSRQFARRIPSLFQPREQHCVSELLQSVLPHLTLQLQFFTEFALMQNCNHCCCSEESLLDAGIDARLLSISLSNFAAAELSIDGLHSAGTDPQKTKCQSQHC